MSIHILSQLKKIKLKEINKWKQQQQKSNNEQQTNFGALGLGKQDQCRAVFVYTGNSPM